MRRLLAITVLLLPLWSAAPAHANRMVRAVHAVDVIAAAIDSAPGPYTVPDYTYTCAQDRPLWPARCRFTIHVADSQGEPVARCRGRVRVDRHGIHVTAADDSTPRCRHWLRWPPR